MHTLSLYDLDEKRNYWQFVDHDDHIVHISLSDTMPDDFYCYSGISSTYYDVFCDSITWLLRELIFEPMCWYEIRIEY